MDLLDIPLANLKLMMAPTEKNFGEFADANGLSLKRIKYKDGAPFLECSILDKRKFLVLKVKYGL